MLRQATIAAVLLLGLEVPDALGRTWNSATGTFKIDAELMEKRADGTILLKRADGVTIETRPEKLTAADQEYIRHWKPAGELKESGEAQAEKAAKPTASVLTPEEQTAIGKIKSAQTKAAVEAYEKKEADLAAIYAAKQKEYREKLAGLLDEALKEAADAGKLDDALAIRNASKALRSGQEPPGTASPPAQAEMAKESRPVKGRIFASCDDEFILCVNGKEVLRNDTAHQITLGEYAFSKGDVITVRALDIGGTRGFCCAIKMQPGKSIVTSARWSRYTPKSESEWFNFDDARDVRPVQQGTAGEEFAIVRNASGINAAVIWGSERVVYLKYAIP